MKFNKRNIMFYKQMKKFGVKMAWHYPSPVLRGLGCWIQFVCAR